MNLPNKITLARICLIPLMVIIPFLNIPGAWFNVPIEKILILLVFLIASFTDYLDGYLARKLNLITDFGKFLDPIADKLLVLTALIMLVEFGIIPGWIPIIVIARELVVSGIRMIAAGEGNVIAASMLGKIKTVSQMLAISLAFIDQNPFLAFAYTKLNTYNLILNIFTFITLMVSVIATLWSGIDYFVKSKDVVLRSK
jgi:CDP-diacylglycerol--glycerol-3-phosphate 3-phosphatidyltransferase